MNAHPRLDLYLPAHLAAEPSTRLLRRDAAPLALAPDRAPPASANAPDAVARSAPAPARARIPWRPLAVLASLAIHAAAGWAFATRMTGASLDTPAEDAVAVAIVLDMPPVAVTAPPPPLALDAAPPPVPAPAVAVPAAPFGLPDTPPDVPAPQRFVPRMPAHIAVLAVPPRIDRPAVATPVPAAKVKPAKDKRAKAAPEPAGRTEAPVRAPEAAPAKAAKPAKAKSAAKPDPRAKAAAGPAGAAPAKSRPGASAAEKSAYGRKLLAHLTRHKPRAAGASGSVGLVVTIGRDGGVRGVKVTRGSGHAGLDAAARTAARAASPFPRPPEGLGGATMSFAATMRFDR